ncbi:unnamed protein product [Orchesella dallaii]|uniref:Uncharacterized protein n=1 Tax=Orchesella dallaii TaxID=48710 RepID=A0ABP1R6V4_9HEXA
MNTIFCGEINIEEDNEDRMNDPGNEPDEEIYTMEQRKRSGGFFSMGCKSITSRGLGQAWNI